MSMASSGVLKAPWKLPTQAAASREGEQGLLLLGIGRAPSRGRRTELNKRMLEEGLREQSEVQALQDTPTGGEGGRGATERLRESRRIRHEKILTDLHAELSTISEELQPAVKRAADDLRSRHTRSEQAIEEIFAKISSADVLQALSLTGLQGVWQEVEEELSLRLSTISQFEKTLSEVEEQRSRKVCEVLQRHQQLLVGVAFLSAGELERAAEEKAHSVNMAVVGNRRAAARLCAELSSAEEELAGSLLRRWEGGVARWSDIVLQATLQQFKTHVTVEGVTAEAGEVGWGRSEVERVKREMVVELSGLHHRWEESLSQLSALAPPTVTMEALSQWREAATGLLRQMESVLSRNLLHLGESWELVTSACEREMEKCKEHLLESGACDSVGVFKVLTTHFLPLAEQAAEQGRREVQDIERSVESHLSQQQSWLQSLVQYGMGAAQLWKDHSSTLVEVQRARGEALERLRTQHDTQNQNMEANLDIVLDRMRQGSTEEVLEQCLQEAVRLLEAIPEGYEEFHRAVLEEVSLWPAAVQKLLATYETSLCQYFGVGRAESTAKQKKDTAPATVAAKKATGRTGSKRSKKTASSKPLPSSSSSSTLHPRPPSLASVVEEVVVSSGAVRYITTGAGQGEGGGVFLTQDEESEAVQHPLASDALPLHPAHIQQTKDRLRAAYLEHLQQWLVTVRGGVKEEVREREEEAHTELDLRHHLHRPRLMRVQQDVHGVRAAELLAHRDRVSRHARGVVSSITQLKTRVQSVGESMQKEEEAFMQSMLSLEAALAEATTTRGLEQVEKRAKKLLEEHLCTLERISSQHQTAAEEAISDLARANTSFRESFKLFSEGGNYSPEEVEMFGHKVERLAGKLAATQAHITSEVGVASTWHTTTSRERFSHFRLIYHGHMTDVSYLEEVKRSLTSLQLSIRGEVAASNSQSSGLENAVTGLKEMVKAGDPSPLLPVLAPLPELCSQRLAYLHCRAAVYQGARVGLHEELSGPGLAPSSSSTSSKGQPISAVNITRSIREHARAGGSGGAPTAAPGLRPAEAKERAGRRPAGQSRRKTPAVERKSVNFGIGGGEEGSSCFLPHIRGLLHNTYSELHKITEAYYSQRGSRVPTRPSLASSFEEAMDKLVETCQSYRLQCESYRNDAIGEFRGQLDSLLAILVDMASLVVNEVKGRHLISAREQRRNLQESHREAMVAMATEKAAHEKALVPGLGHPSSEQELKALGEKEEDRHQRCLQEVQHHASCLQKSERDHGRAFAEELVEVVGNLLRLFDSITLTSEVIPGSGREQVRQPAGQLLREHLKPQDKERAGGAPPTLSAAGGQWAGLSTSDLAVLGQGEAGEGERVAAELSSAVSSRKSSAAHTAVITGRDTALQEYLCTVRTVVEECVKIEREEVDSEGRWWDNWTTSLARVRQLYQ